MLVLEGIRYKLDLDGCESGKQVISDQILILFSEAFDHVLDIAWGMLDDEWFSGVHKVAWGKMVMVIMMLFYVIQKVVIPNVDWAAFIK